MSSPYVGEIRAVGFTFAPVGWAACNGQALSINDNQVLYALIGTTYGGDGVTSFNVPDLRGRVAVGAQGGPGLTNYALGQAGGQENVTPTANQLPPHGHGFSSALGASTAAGTTDNPAGNLPGNLTGAYGGAPSGGATLAATALTGTTAPAGGSQPHANIQPVLALNYIIATEGIFPPQP